MTEINVTHLLDEDCSQWSDSVANSGLRNVGPMTWRNAVETATEAPLVPSDGIDEVRDWIIFLIRVQEPMLLVLSSIINFKNKNI